MRPVCLYVVGEPPDAIRAAFGDYAAWFGELADLTAVDGLAPAPDVATPAWLRQWSGIVVTGSAASVVAAPPWSEAWVETAARVVLDAATAGVPVLGVCYGHQLAAAAYGAEVRASAVGWQGGTRRIDVSDAGQADPLFDGIDPSFGAQQCHSDEVVPTDGVSVLATGEHGVEAIAIGEVVRGVQFHPEFSTAITRAYVEINGGTNPVNDAPQARQVFANFVHHFVERA